MTGQRPATLPLDRDVATLLPAQPVAALTLSAQCLLHVVPLLEPMELSLVLYLRLQHVLRGGASGLAQYDANDPELAAWVGCSARSIRRWRTERYQPLKTAIKVLVPEIEQVIDYHGTMPYVVGFRYTFWPDDPPVTDALLAEARVYAHRGERKPFPERLQEAQAAFASDRIRRGLPPAPAKVDGAQRPKWTERPGQSSHRAAANLSVVDHDVNTQEDHAHDHDPYAGYETPGVTPKARRAYERWLWHEVHRLTRDRPLRAKEYFAFLKWYTKIGDGAATRAAGRVRETMQERTLGDPLAYLMTTMKGLA